MESIKETIKSMKNKPKIIVFDLDFTLWNLGIQLFFYKFPYKKVEHKVLDSEDKEMKPFPEVNDLLKFLDEEIKIPLGLASRSSFPEGGLSLLNLYDWMKYFKFIEIYPGQKTSHFEQISSKSNINYEDMLFFDDEERNIKDLSPIGVTCFKIDSTIGMNFDYLLKGLEVFSKKYSEKSSQ